MPKTLKSLNGSQLDQLETKLQTWVRHYKAEHSAPETVSTPPPVASVHVSPLVPLVQQNTGPAPVAVPAHAVGKQHVETHAAPVAVPASPDFGGGRSRISASSPATLQREC